MLIYSVVQTVRPGFVGSYQPGRHEVEHFTSEAAAQRYCDLCNNCRCNQSDNKLSYSVECVDEESPDRAPL